MSRNTGNWKKTLKARHDRAIERPELRFESAPREFPQAPFSMAVKKVDPDLRSLIDQAIAERTQASARTSF